MKKELERSFRPKLVKVDKSLDKYLEMNPFKEKMDRANEILERCGLPDFDKIKAAGSGDRNLQSPKPAAES